MTRILVTGSAGQISTELIPALAERGYEIIATDIRPPPEDELEFAEFQILDVTDSQKVDSLIGKFSVDAIIHNASILSAKGEQDPLLALNVNFRGLENVLLAAKKHRVKKVLIPSSIAAFGPQTPKDHTPNDTIMRPTTIYGISKVYVELLGEYFHSKYGLDFRSLRYPGVISAKTKPGGGTTDWAVEIFYEGIETGSYTCFVKKDTIMPMMAMPDCINATIQLFEAPEENLIHRSFNVAGVSFTPEMLETELKRHIPDLQVEYKPDFRQLIADSWPRSIDDSVAREEWGWKHEYDLPKLVDYMFSDLSMKLKSKV